LNNHKKFIQDYSRFIQELFKASVVHMTEQSGILSAALIAALI